MGISFTVMMSAISVQHREAKAIKQQLVSINLKHWILQTLRNPENCHCQLRTKTLNVNNYDDIDLGEFRSGCDFSLIANNFIATAGQKVKGGLGLKVSSVKIKDIGYTGTTTGTIEEYSGALTVEYKREGAVRPLRSVEVDVSFTVDNTQGSPSVRPIQSCVDNVGSGSNSNEDELYFASGSGTLISASVTGTQINLNSAFSSYRYLHVYYAVWTSGYGRQDDAHFIRVSGIPTSKQTGNSGVYVVTLEYPGPSNGYPLYYWQVNSTALRFQALYDTSTTLQTRITRIVGIN